MALYLLFSVSCHEPLPVPIVLGKIDFESDPRSCLVCENSTDNRRFFAGEKMFGNGGAFDYMECGNCKAIMLMARPEDMAPFYPENYYSYEGVQSASSFKDKLQDKAMRAVVDHRLGRSNTLGRFLAKRTGTFQWVRRGMFSKESSILDVGCGNGTLLNVLHRAGFKDLTGADPYIAEDIEYPNSIRIYKKELKELERKFRFIMMNHTFEHLVDPLAVLKTIGDKLEPGGKAMIRIPVADCWAWKHYGLDWVQLDAPRHFFLHTVKSMEHLVDQTDLHLEHVEFDSTQFQFVGSEKYKRGLPLDAAADFLANEELDEFKRKAVELNKEGQGDTASFYFAKV